MTRSLSLLTKLLVFGGVCWLAWKCLAAADTTAAYQTGGQHPALTQILFWSFYLGLGFLLVALLRSGMRRRRGTMRTEDDIFFNRLAKQILREDR